MVASESVVEDEWTTPLLPFSLVHVLGRNREEAHNMDYFFKGMFLMVVAWALLYKFSHFLSKALWKTYSTLPADKQAEWNSRLVSNVNAILMCFDMAYFLPIHSGVRETVFNPSVTTPPLLITVLMMRFSSYMFYDFFLMVIYKSSFGDLPSLFHHALAWSACVWFQYNGAGVWYFFSLSLMEATTPFVNQHWFFTVANMKGSMWFAVNGITMFVGFFVFRVCLTTTIMIQFWWLTWPVRDVDNFPRPHLYIIPVWFLLIGGLNYFWFYKITRGMLRMLSTKGTKKE